MDRQLLEWMKMDPSNRPQPVWGVDAYKNYIAEFSKELRTNLEKQFIYGTPKVVKEREVEIRGVVEIGGTKCHLCGADIFHSEIGRTMEKKHRNVESHKAYECGTQIYETWREKDDILSGYKRTRHIHVGNECLDVS